MRNLIRNKRGDMVLRDLIFIIIIFTGLIALCSIFVNQIGTTYEDYTNMSSDYNQDAIGSSQLSETGDVWTGIAENMQGNIFDFLLGTLQAAGEILKEVIAAPATFSNLVSNVLKSFGVISEELIGVFAFILTAILYILIIFVIITAFLPGGGKT